MSGKVTGMGILVVLGAFAFSSGAFAMTRTQSSAPDAPADRADSAIRNYSPLGASDPQYVNSLFSSYVSDAQAYQKQYVDSQIQKTTGVAAQDTQEYRKVVRDREVLLKTVSDTQGRIDEGNRQLSTLRSSEARLRQDIERAQLSSDRQKAQQDLDKNLADQGKLTQQIEQYQRLMPPQDLVDRTSRAVDVKYAGYEQSVKGLRDKLDGNGKAQLEFDGFNAGVDQMYNKMKETSYDAKLLLTNFDVLREKNKLDGMQLQVLQDKLQPHLENTLLGKFIQAQIDRKLKEQSCSQMATCSAVPGVSSINGVLSKPLDPTATVQDFRAPAATAVTPAK